MIEEGSSFSGSFISGQAPVAGRSQILLHRRPSLPLKRAFAHLDDKAQHTDMSWSASSCRLHRMEFKPLPYAGAGVRPFIQSPGQ
jgi:hypothetical protein